MSTTEQISAPLIRRLTIERFRGIQKLVWYPQPGVNVVLGGGDVGKTTILDALALLFTPGNPPVLSDSDYWCRLVEQGFCIEAVMSLPSDIGINQQGKPAWPWQWDGAEPRLPDTEGDDPPTPSAGVEPVYRLQVRGTSDFEAVFELHQPDGTYDHLSVNTRRRIGMVRLSGDDRNDRDLRLVQGSALDRLIADKAIRSRIAQRIGEKGIDEEVRPDAKQKLVALGTIFKANALPSDLALGLTGGQGFSLNALIGLTAKKDDVHLPLASWGAGTRRLAALQIAAEQQGACPITLVDEVERGLEPYRQRVLMKTLQDSRSHVFVTTHSAVALAAASQSTIWYMDAKGAIGRLPDSIAAHHRSDPETFLARVAVIAEGKTEKGFVEELLRRAIEPSHLELGIWVTDAGGNEQALTFLEGCVGSGLQFAGFVDDDGSHPTKWATLEQQLGTLLLRWSEGCLEENVIGLVPTEQLEEFIKDPDGESGARRRTLADRVGINENDFATLAARTPDIRQLIIEAASGFVPPDRPESRKGENKAWKKHGQQWFKSLEGGCELAKKVFDLGLWPGLSPRLLPFLNAIRAAVGLQALETLPG
jgi:putative ATP-dependent endonuclease of OLD family